MIGSAAPSSNDMPSGSTVHAARRRPRASRRTRPCCRDDEHAIAHANPSTPLAPTARTTPASSAPGTNGNGGFT